MPNTRQKTFVLTGGLKGQTVSLGSQQFKFVDGKLTFDLTEKEMSKMALFLKRNWQAVPEEDVNSQDKPKSAKETKVKQE